jgi:hypothetical protein
VDEPTNQLRWRSGWELARHGILYPSRLKEERMVALYERVLDKVRTVVTILMIELRKELAALIDQRDPAMA